MLNLSSGVDVLPLYCCVCNPVLNQSDPVFLNSDREGIVLYGADSE